MTSKMYVDRNAMKSNIKTMIQCCFNAGPSSATLFQHCKSALDQHILSSRIIDSGMMLNKNTANTIH